MKIAIPVDEDRKSVCVSFGRAPFFMVSDTETGVTEVHENAAAQAEGGAGLKAAQIVVDFDTDALITVRCGENAAKVLQAAEIQIYKNDSMDAMENVEALKAGKLSLLDHFHAGFHGGHQG